jgi:hypothetical protein
VLVEFRYTADRQLERGEGGCSGRHFPSFLTMALEPAG